MGTINNAGDIPTGRTHDSIQNWVLFTCYIYA